MTCKVCAWLKSLIPLVETDVEKAAKAIQAKADADIAALRVSAVNSAAAKLAATNLAAFEAAVADYKARIKASVTVAITGPTGPTGA